MPGHAAAEDLGPVGGIRRARRVEEQAGIERLPGRLGVDAETPAEPYREQRGLQAVLERQRHPEIGRQAEGAGDLGGAQPIGVWRCRRHTPIVNARFYLSL